ncbi:GNAT family N-acetyltransferase [Deinococcus altitudinis]|uniref:GNAT family N-acetyltransferase n=1 Tax=Deinococcus altitudinis TaxID=468914 RepID=UPI003891AE34
MSFRQLEPRDEATVRGWLTVFLRQHQDWWAAGYDRSPAATLPELVERDWQELVQAAASPQRLVAVLDVGGQAAGIVQAGVRADRSMGFQIGVLQWIYVAPEARGQGLADRLMRHALDWMDAQGVSGREVFVTALNPAAVRLYERHGFGVADYRMLARAVPPTES